MFDLAFIICCVVALCGKMSVNTLAVLGIIVMIVDTICNIIYISTHEIRRK